MAGSGRNTPLFCVSGSTHKGRIREVNEDAWWAAAFSPGSRNPLGVDAVAMVADGMGGHDAGEYASSYAVRFVQDICTGERGESLKEVPIEDVCSRIVEALNEELHARAGRFSDSHPGTTVTLVLVRGSTFYLGHVGDSRAYLVSVNGAEQLTEDHTWTAEQVRSGVLTAEEAAVSPLRSQLVQAVGTRPTVTVYRRMDRLGPGHALLLCTDGLFDHLNAGEIAGLYRASQGPTEAANSLVSLALERGGEDNLTAVLLSPASSSDAPTIALRLPGFRAEIRRKQTTVGVLAISIIGLAVLMVALALLTIYMGW